MNRPHRRVVATFALGVALLALPACGTASDNDARSAAERFLAAMDASQTAEACGFLAPRVIADFEEQCDQQLVDSGIAPAPVDAIEAWGDNALAHTAGGAVFLHKFDRGWLVTGAGCQPEADKPYECAVGGP